MCGRAALTASPEDLMEAFGLDAPPAVVPHYNVTPSQPVAVLRVSPASGGRVIEPLRWGLLPPWAKDSRPSSGFALARVETIRASRAFRDAVRRRRCLVVVDGFYEWRREGAGPRQPFFIRQGDGRPFALAGIWDRWTSADGEVIESCAIVTQAARPPVDAIHDRMPLVLERDVWPRWLDPAPLSDDALEPLLAPRAHALSTFPVSTHVNDPRHDDPRCIEPAEPTEPAQLTLI